MARERIVSQRYNSARERRGCNWRKIKQLIKVAIFPWPVLRFLQRHVGGEYGIGIRQKLDFCFTGCCEMRPRRAAQQLFTTMSRSFMAFCSVPAELNGYVAEIRLLQGRGHCKLVSCLRAYRETAKSLSIISKVCPSQTRKLPTFPPVREVPYRAGQYHGTLEERKAERFRGGDLSVCEFIKGFFDGDAAIARRRRAI